MKEFEELQEGQRSDGSIGLAFPTLFVLIRVHSRLLSAICYSHYHL
jgi:hypothetical protein